MGFTGVVGRVNLHTRPDLGQIADIDTTRVKEGAVEVEEHA